MGKSNRYCLFASVTNPRALAFLSSVRDFWTQGGMLIFGKNGLLIHAAHDELGIEFDIAAAQEAVQNDRAILKSVSDLGVVKSRFITM
jgi:hypothetical protein